MFQEGTGVEWVVVFDVPFRQIETLPFTDEFPCFEYLSVCSP